MSRELLSWLIFSSNFCLSCFSLRYSVCQTSRAFIAAFLSSSAYRFWNSNYDKASPLGFEKFESRLFNSSLSFFNSHSYFLSRALWSTSSLIFAEFLIFFALVANFNVEIDSLYPSNEGDIMAIIVVLQFPPRESSSRRVSLESL